MAQNNYEYRQKTTAFNIERTYSGVFDIKRIKQGQARQRPIKYNIHENVLIPKVTFRNDKEVILTYKGNHIYQTLFTSYFEKRIANQKRRGDYFSFFTFKQRFDMALVLCDIFSTLNYNYIVLKYPSDDMIMVDDETGEIYLDLLPATLQRTDASEKFIKELNIKYTCAMHKNIQNSVEKNNLILAFLIFKLFKGDDCIAWDVYSEYTKKFKKIGICDDLPLNNMLLGDDFYLSLDAIVKKGQYPSYLTSKTPSAWKQDLIKFRCLCTNGYFTETSNGNLMCCECGRKWVGWVENVRTRKKLPLLTPNTDYTQRMFFNHALSDGFLFKMHERNNQEKRELAAFFNLGDEVRVFLPVNGGEAMEELPVNQKNSKGNLLQLNFTAGISKTVKINEEQFIFSIFKSQGE